MDGFGKMRKAAKMTQRAKPEPPQTVQADTVAGRVRHRRVNRAQRNRRRSAGMVRFLALSTLRRSVSDAKPANRCVRALNRKPV